VSFHFDRTRESRVQPDFRRIEKNKKPLPIRRRLLVEQYSIVAVLKVASESLFSMECVIIGGINDTAATGRRSRVMVRLSATCGAEVPVSLLTSAADGGG
jgi:hypothetical protein